MKNLGFTLVELLGVIIIIGALVTIIAVSVSGVLDNSETKLTQIQIDKVEEAAKNYYINEGMESSDFEENQFSHCVSVNYLIENGYIDDNEVKNFETGDDILGSVRISYNSKKYDYKYQEKTCQICVPATSETKTTGNVPTGRYNLGDEYICEVKDDVKYHFFVLSTEGDNVNLILDRNINSDGTLAEKPVTEAETTNGIYSRTPWISAQDYSDNNVNNLSCKYEACANLPPITALNFLNNATKDWKNVGNLNDKYMDEGNRYGKIELVGKARLPKIIELENAGCREGEDNLGSCPLWLANNVNINSYWALTSGKAGSAWTVYSDNRLRTISVYLNVGIRPVITLTKEDIENKDRR